MVFILIVLEPEDKAGVIHRYIEVGPICPLSLLVDISHISRNVSLLPKVLLITRHHLCH